MFKQLIELWKGKITLFDEVHRDFQEMLSTAQYMFKLVTDALDEGEMKEDLKKEIYKLDASLNLKEQSIRRKVVTLLAGGAEEPISAALVMMSVSKDAERLGDYAKNILQVFEVKPHLTKEKVFYDRFIGFKGKISSLFEQVLKAYCESDKVLARSVYKESFDQQKICDQNVKELLMAPPAEDLVAHAVLTRFFKRIFAHLSNIATGVYLPITKIDYFDPKVRDAEMNK